MKRTYQEVDVPIGRVEIMGQVMHLVEHRGRLVGAMPDETGQVVVVMRNQQVSAAGCRRLLRGGIDLLLNRAERVLRNQATEHADEGRSGDAGTGRRTTDGTNG